MGPEFQPPVTLEGARIQLVPLDPAHAPALVPVAADRQVFEFLSYGPYEGVEAVRGHIHELLRRQALGTDLAFTVVRRRDGAPVGMTRYLNIERENEAVEIGGTWFDRRFWRGPYNTESKRLLLAYAFEVERVHRVAIQTDLRNERSQRAIERIGGRREGVLRENRIVRDGYRRSSVVYSILAEEWPELRTRLDGWISRSWEEPAATPSRS
ncbi:MAG: GNAT family N-acetyltransferase [Thermoplasmata archaeon]|nr:GNAT family N-acetyltransferase [Thermoplasmata archaeon]MCI4355588.1 GNAT family N-acetyltransferase [Thermoplasmata archaeon]